MARNKEFSPDLVLQRAEEIFQEKGYETTSLADLVDYLGIGRSSLYGTFGSKHSLYVKTLKRYRDAKESHFLDALGGPGPVLLAIESTIDCCVAEALAEPRGRGCLIVSAAVELSPHDARVTEQVRGNWSVYEAGLTRALTRAQAQGELAEDKNPQELARFLLVLHQGIHVVGRAAPDTAVLHAAADGMRAALRR